MNRLGRDDREVRNSGCAGFVMIALAVAVLTLTGCMPSGGVLIRPAPADQSLMETVVRRDPGFASDKVAIIDISGIITDSSSSNFLSSEENPVSVFTEKLRKAANDNHVKAVVLRINSPGGGVTASDMMREELLRFRARTKKPVVAMLMDVAASGGYYVACGSDEIIAQPTGITGSIGVIFQTFELSELMEKIGVHTDAVVSGRHKDTGSPLRPMRPEERDLFQGLVDQMYSRFIQVVRTGRPKLSEESILKLADGRVFLGVDAAKNGLVDSAGTMDDAIDAAAKRANLGKRPIKVVVYGRPLAWRPTVYAQSPLAPPMAGSTTVNLLNLNVPPSIANGPQFLYLWTAGQ